MVPVPTFEKVTVTVSVPVPAPYLQHKKQIFQKKIWNFFLHLFSKLFYKEKDYKFQQIYGKMWKKKMFNEGNQIHNFMSSSGSDFLTSYGSSSGSTSQKVTVPKTSYGSGSTTLFLNLEPSARKPNQHESIGMRIRTLKKTGIAIF